MGMGQGAKTGLGHEGITCVLQTQFSFFSFFLGGWGWDRGTWPLENNSLFLGNKTNVRECLKIILWNKADHKKIFVCCIPSYCPYSSHPTHFMALIGNNYSFLVILL